MTGNLPGRTGLQSGIAGRNLVVGTEVGAFVTKRGGGSVRWSQLGRGLPNVTVWDLTVTKRGLVVAGTHGRGDWEINLR